MRVRKLIIATGLIINLSACSVSQVIGPPAEGYEAVRFKQPVSVRDHAINTYTFNTGSTFIADHQIPHGVDGPIFCGIAFRNDVLFAAPTCFALEGDTTLVLNAGCDLPSALGCGSAGKYRPELLKGSG